MTQPVEDQHLLTTRQLANFVTDGLLVFPDLVPESINAAAREEIFSDTQAFRSQHGLSAGASLFDHWPDTPGLGALIRMPEVRGIIRSLVGPDPLYDHFAFHAVRETQPVGQHWHGDAIIDTRVQSFDIQLFYYSHDTPREMGGTMFLPGSHFRQVSESNIARYHNFVNQMPVVCKAGTLVVGHHGLWHCAQPNFTQNRRMMFKLRLNPTVRQTRLWNDHDVDSPDTVRNVESILTRDHGWYGGDHGLEIWNRVQLWRSVTGDASQAPDHWLTRLEADADAVANADLAI